MPSTLHLSNAKPRLRGRRLLLAIALTMPQAMVLLGLAVIIGLASTTLQAAPEKVGAAIDTDWILAHLQRPLPASTPFLELRGSRLLKAPLRISGHYRRPDAKTMVRDVSAPYQETTTIRDGQASVVRNGQATRRFALSRAPELAALQASFGALLSGDRAQLERYYRVAASGQTGRWQLVLTPKDAALAAKTREIVLYGRGAELRCIETRLATGDPQRTLLAGAAANTDPLVDAAELATICHGTGHGE